LAVTRVCDATAGASLTQRQPPSRCPEFLQKGWQIGSGPTEAMCKTTRASLKRRSMRWDADPGAPGLAGLEQSDQWKLYWQSRLKPSG